VRLVRTQKFGREAQIGNDTEIRSAAEHDSTGSQTQPNPAPHPADRVLFATTKTKYALLSVLPTCLIRGPCRVPTRSPGSVARIRSPLPARAEQRAKLCWSNATPNTTRPHGDVTVRRGASLAVSACPSHLEGGKPGGPV